MTVTLCELEAMAQWNSWFIELKDGDFPVQKYCKHVCQRVSIWKHPNKYWIILVCLIGSVRKWGIHPPKTAQTDMKKDASDKLGTRLTGGRDEISTSAMIVLFFRLNSNGKSVEVHFGQCTRPCHWLKRFHLVIRWGKICFFVILRCSQTICFSGWNRHWKSWYFFRRSWSSRREVHNVASRACEVLEGKFTT